MKKIIIYPVFILIALTMGCNNNKQQEPTQDAADILAAKNQVALSAEQMNVIKLKTGKISKQNIENVVKASGYVDVPPTGKAVISPMVPGYIRQIRFLIGNQVRRGEIMAALESMDYVELQQQYVELNSKLGFLKDEYERQKTLQAQNATARKKLLMAEYDYKSALSVFDGVKEKLNIIGTDFNNLANGSISSVMYLRAPISGTVTNVTATVGKHVDPQEELFEIVNPGHKHIELEVFEKDIMKVKKDQLVLFSIPNYGNTLFKGKVFLVGQSLEPDQRYVKVHVHPDDEESNFKVGMYVKASIVTNDQATPALPREAVVVQGGQEYIFVHKGEQEGKKVFEKMPVITGIENQGWIELKLHDGISEMDDVVVSGAFYLLNAFAASEQ